MRTLLLLVAIALSAACGGAAQGMRPETAPKYVPPTGMATVVFARHTNFGGAINFVAVDQNRKFVAGMKGKAHAVATLAPGDYTFYVIAENTDVIHAKLEADRTYVIEARVRMGVWKAQVTAESVRRNTPRFAEAPSWIKGTDALVPNGSTGQQWVDSHGDNIAKRIAQTDAAWAQKDASWQAQHTLAPEDGYAQAEFKGAVGH
jgi:hypothetical protein